MKNLIRRIPIVGPFTIRVARRLRGKRAPEFPGSADYWEERYKSGGDSGCGSYAMLAEFKAEVLNNFVKEHAIKSVVEFGCGDGNQLRLAEYATYTGYDVSPTVVECCKEMFAADSTKKFYLIEEYRGQNADLAASLDVIYHLVEDSVYETYMTRLFDSAQRYVVIYSSNYEFYDLAKAPHVRHHQFTKWIEQNRSDWRQIASVPNRYPYDSKTRAGSFADFYFFERCV